MEVKKVYQDKEGKWHIDYDSSHLMGLAIRVYFGQILITIFISIFIILPILILTSIASGNSLHKKEKDIAPSSNYCRTQESVNSKLANY